VPCYGVLAGSGASRQTAAEAVDLARLAVERDRTDAFAQAVFGYALCALSRDYDQARLHAQEAIRLNPSSAFALGVSGILEFGGGDFEAAVENLGRAIELSPYDTMLYMWMTVLASSYFGLESSSPTCRLAGAVAHAQAADPATEQPYPKTAENPGGRQHQARLSHHRHCRQEWAGDDPSSDRERPIRSSWRLWRIGGSRLRPRNCARHSMVG
jgi:tetratricopeptide (TPR) repeat protein